MNNPSGGFSTGSIGYNYDTIFGGGVSLGYSQTDTGQSIISGMNSQVSWNVNSGFHSHNEISYSWERTANLLAGHGAISDIQVALNEFESQYGDLNELDKAFQKAAMGLPLTEYEVDLIAQEQARQEAQRQAAQRKETQNVLQGAARHVAKKDEQTEEERQAERNAIEGAKERIQEEIEDYKNLLNMAIEAGSFLLNASDEDKLKLSAKIDAKINRLLEDPQYREQAKDELLKGIKEAIAEEAGKFARLNGDDQDKAYALVHTALTFPGLIKKGFKNLAKMVDGDGIVSGVAGGAGKKVVGYRPFTKANYRHNLQVMTGIDGTGMDAHHIFPQADRFKSQWERVGINIHDPKNLTWMESNYHRSTAAKYNQDWDTFFRQHPNANQQQIESFGNSIIKKYGK